MGLGPVDPSGLGQVGEGGEDLVAGKAIHCRIEQQRMHRRDIAVEQAGEHLRHGGGQRIAEEGVEPVGILAPQDGKKRGEGARLTARRQNVYPPEQQVALRLIKLLAVCRQSENGEDRLGDVGRARQGLKHRLLRQMLGSRQDVDQFLVRHVIGFLV